MRILVPRRIVGLIVLFGLLWLMPATSPTVLAKPVPYDNKDDPNPPPPPGDGDGVVVKAGTVNPTPTLSTTTTRASGRITVWSLASEYFRLMRMGFGFRWYW